MIQLDICMFFLSNFHKQIWLVQIIYNGFTSACFSDQTVHLDRNSCVAFRSSNNPNKNKQDPSEIRFRSLSSDKTSSQSRYRANISCFICFDFCFTRSIAAAAQPTYCSGLSRESKTWCSSIKVDVAQTQNWRRGKVDHSKLLCCGWSKPRRTTAVASSASILNWLVLKSWLATGVLSFSGNSGVPSLVPSIPLPSQHHSKEHVSNSAV